MDEDVKIKFKFKCVLLELLKGDYKVTDDTIFEKLITHLSGKDVGLQVIDIPLCLAWIRSLVLSWYQGKTPPSITCFGLRLMGIIVENEGHFINIQKAVGATEGSPFDSASSGCRFMQQLMEMFKSTSQASGNFSLKCALIHLLSSLSKHSTGHRWIMSSGLWRDVHAMSLNDSSIYVVRDGRRFLSNLLNDMPENQELWAETVLSYVLEPFVTLPSYQDQYVENVRVTSSLHLTYAILENVFQTFDPEKRTFYSPVIGIIFHEKFGLVPKCLEALKLTKSEEWEEMLSKIATLMYILDLIKDGQKRASCDVKGACILILNIFNILINKGSVDNVLKLCVMCHNHWTYVGKVQRRENEDPGCVADDAKRYRFEDQLLCLQLAPIFCCIVNAPIENEKELYLCKMFHKTCFESQRLVFTFRNMVLLQQQVHLFSSMSARSIMFLAKTLSRNLPLYVGISLPRDELEEIAEAHINKIVAIVHSHVLRLVYALRDTIVKHGFEERVALLSVSSMLSVKHVLNRITPLCVGCTLGDSPTEVDFQVKCCQQLEEDSLRSIYLLRDSLVKNNHLMDSSALFAVSSITSLVTRSVEYDRERAVMVFQSFIYVLKHFVVCAESETKQGGWGGEFRQSHHSTLLVAILDGLASLVRSHRITWRESVESLCLLTLAQQLLDSPTFSTKVGLVVQALHLIQLCIENFMPPNLALLTNSISGTSFDQLGPLIFKRLHDPHWEVRDSSLEVLHTLATISHTKYPLFQDLILSNKLCELVVHLALNDAEAYVCASATKCLAAMVQVDRLWNEELSDKDLVNKMIGVLNGESEGVLRREASLLLTQIFKHRKVPSDVLDKVCITMSSVVLSDLHWEVKVNSLSFWELIIEHHMNNQGMIDGYFPQVTFSREHRKIINLTPTAIQERLRKVLADLSQNGCLFVLLEAICKDEDLEVVKKAAEIIKSLSVVLERHGLLEPNSMLNSASNSQEAPSISNPSPQLSPSLEQTQCNSLADPHCVPQLDETTNVKSEKSQNVNSIKQNVISDSPAGKCIVDLDPQAMGFAVLGDDVSSISQKQQDDVIDSILNDKDINLLGNVYLGTGVEVPGRQGPETKMSRPVRPLVVLSSAEFLHQLATLQVDQIVYERTRWIKDTGSNLHTLLDDMLITRRIECNDDEECNVMDCY